MASVLTRTIKNGLNVGPIRPQGKCIRYGPASDREAKQQAMILGHSSCHPTEAATRGKHRAAFEPSCETLHTLPLALETQITNVSSVCSCFKELH